MTSVSHFEIQLRSKTLIHKKGLSQLPSITVESEFGSSQKRVSSLWIEIQSPSIAEVPAGEPWPSHDGLVDCASGVPYDQ
jgi:hypothetical protein